MLNYVVYFSRHIRAIRLLVVLASALVMAAPLHAQPGRPRVGVAFGGGSARGLAHIGIIRWFEEHHVPIDVAAGTSMGGLVGGAFAAGMPADELRALIVSTDWDAMFGSSGFAYKNVRRKEDARDFPSRLEFGVRHGIVPPTALNNGQQVDLLLARIGGAYSQLDSFDELPTPFRTVAVDLKKSERVVLERGSFAEAMRATMSLPGVFPPVDLDSHVLVDGGALDNIPADVVREMGASFVVAVDVGYAADEKVDYSLFGLMSQTIDSMMRANTRRALQSADLVIAIDVEGFGSLDWRRAEELIERGYRAAEQHRDTLLRYAVDEAGWQAWIAERERRRKRIDGAPAYLRTADIVASDAAIVTRQLSPHVGQPLDIPRLETDLATLSGLDRYQSLVWQMTGPPDNQGLLVRARPKAYGPPFLMLGLNLENTSSDDFRFTVAARYLAFDVLGPSSELRIDGALGSDPHAGFSLHRPLFASRLFVRPFGLAEMRTTDVIQNDHTVAQYRQKRFSGGGDLGVVLDRESELTGGVQYGRVDATVRAGDPGLPELGGAEATLRFRYLHDGQDSPVVPSRGTRAAATLTHYLQSPIVEGVERTNADVTQFEFGVSKFWSRNRVNRLFVVAAGGTSFGDHPISQFKLGYPFRLDAFRVGERRGDHYAVLTGGVARAIGRLPDFLGGPIYVGAWWENGSAFDTDQDADINSHLGLGVIMDTLVGPVVLGTGIGLDGGFRVLIGVGRLVR